MLIQEKISGTGYLYLPGQKGLIQPPLTIQKGTHHPCADHLHH